MESLNSTATRVLHALLKDQPTTGAKVAFAWQIAAGATLARSATVSWNDGVLYVHAKSPAWSREIARARPMIGARMRDLLGPHTLRHLVVTDAP